MRLRVISRCDTAFPNTGCHYSGCAGAGGIFMAQILPAAFIGCSLLALAAAPAIATTWGPYNVEVPAAGDQVRRDIKQDELSGQAFTVSGWFKPQDITKGKAPIASVGDWLLFTQDGRVTFEAPGISISGKTTLKAGAWTFVTLTSDGTTTRLYTNGKAIGEAKGRLDTPSRSLILAPRVTGNNVYSGKIAGFEVSDTALDAKGVKALATQTPKEDLINFDTGSPTWPIQVRQMYGQVEPQDAWTLPTSKTPPTSPVAKPPYSGPVLVAGDHDTAVIKTWFLQAAPKVSAKAEAISSAGFDSKSWYQATTPGTVLTTLVDRGVYPDPDYGLNNLAIPETLNRQDYWYRSEFPLPATYKADGHMFVTFKGINYAAEVWINGQKLGGIKGAFIRGDFDISPYVKSGTNAIAVKVSPVPHPGIPQEESLAAGAGNNGGAQAQDGPTFIASEGWDWIPSVRDRNTGLWQDVVLKTTGDVRLGDAQIITALPKVDNSEADITINVPVTNLSAAPVTARIQAAVSDRDGGSQPILVSRDVTLAPGEQTITFTPADFSVLKIQHPRLWWPNGYGAPDLHVLNLKVFTGDTISDTSDTRFGIRQVTYELSLVDQTGHLDRVEANFTKGHELGVRITDGSHTGIRRIAGDTTNGGNWATTLRPEAEGTAAVTPLTDSQLSPYLVIKVNGVRIAARGGNWGTDDWRKRVSRENLEPYFRLHRDAHVNIIRNWVGQNTEDTFYDLADEYGLMVLNDFWASTQDYQLEPGDVDLFLDNAKDVVKRYRNHPSIILWFGRNEGVPQPVLNQGLEDLIYKYDGTRWYTGSSNRVNLQNSGPYSFKTPESYFTEHARGFSVEVGTASFPTLEAFKAAVPESEQWPISDTWAYHDWHPDSNGSTKPFEATLAAEFGAPISLSDFDRKAQMLNLESHRAIFEGMNAGLWTKNSGRLLWMTQPAWPSTMWQIISHDYDTQASFYGVKAASEPVHIQMNLPDRQVVVVNNPATPLAGSIATAEVYDISGQQISKVNKQVNVNGGAITAPMDFGIGAAVSSHKVVIVKLSLTAADGSELSRNVYWQGVDQSSLQVLNSLPQQDVALSAIRTESGVTVTLNNASATAVLENKLTLLDDKGNRILPAYYSENYISLVPGEQRTVTIDYQSKGSIQVALRGWNTAAKSVTIP